MSPGRARLVLEAFIHNEGPGSVWGTRGLFRPQVGGRSPWPLGRFALVLAGQPRNSSCVVNLGDTYFEKRETDTNVVRGSLRLS